jgi:hypothetical protein
MAFAIFYNRQDLTPLAAEISNANIIATNAEKTLANKIWQGGLNNWSTAPTALSNPDPRVQAKAGGDPDCRYVVITATQQGQPVTAADFRTLLYSVASKNPGAGYLVAIANDMAGEDAIADPWPIP